MSTEARLKRLGLLHLKDKPEELKAEFRRRIDNYNESKQPSKSVDHKKPDQEQNSDE